MLIEKDHQVKVEEVWKIIQEDLIWSMVKLFQVNHFLTRKKVKKTLEDEEKKTDPTMVKYYSHQSHGQITDKSNANVQKENKPMNIAQNEVMLAKSLNKEEKEEQLKNLLIDYQDLAKHKNRTQSQKHEEEENFEEDESNRVYAR